MEASVHQDAATLHTPEELARRFEMLENYLAALCADLPSARREVHNLRMLALPAVPPQLDDDG